MDAAVADVTAKSQQQQRVMVFHWSSLQEELSVLVPAEQSSGHELIADALNLRLTRDESSMSGVNRVMTENQLVRVFGRGTENESRRTIRLNGKGAIGFLKRHKFASGNRLWRAYGALGDCEPGNFMIQWRVIGPSFTCRELNIQIVNTLRGENRAFGATMGAQDDPRGLFRWHLVNRQIMALAWAVLEFFRQRDPQLKAFRLLQGRSGMPNAAAGPHPLNAAG